MNTEQIMMLNCKKDENGMVIIQKALRLIKPLKRYEDVEERVPQEMVEKVINTIVGKYHMQIQWITHTKQPISGDLTSWWSCSIKRDDTHEWLGSFYACTMYELLAKCAIKLYSLTRGGEIPVRSEDDVAEMRKRLSKNVEELNDKQG